MKTFSSLWKNIAGIKLLFMLGTTLYLFSIVFDFFMVGIQKLVIDDVYLKQDNHNLLLYLLILICVVLLEIVFYSIYEVIIEQCKFISGESARARFMESFFSQSFSSIRKEKVGKINSYLNEYINSTQSMIEYTPKLFGTAFNILLLVTFIVLVHPLILVLCVIASLTYTILSKHFGDLNKILFRSINESKAELTSHYSEGISSLREILAFNRSEADMEKLSGKYETYLNKLKKLVKLKNKQIFGKEPINWIVNLVVFGYIGYLVVHGTVSLGTFIILIQFVDRLITILQDIYQQIIDYSGNLAAIEQGERLFPIYDKSIKEKDKEFSRPITSIQFKDVHAGYAEKAVLKGINITIPIGKKVAIVGASGSGKSTIAGLLMKMFEPQRGDIIINNVPLANVSMDSWVKKASIVFQETYFFPDTIANNVLMGRDISRDQLYATSREVLVHETIQSLPNGYETLIGERGVLLSGGQRQRIAIARSLVGQPELLILDESTSALDQETERTLQRHIDELRKGKTTVIIAHRLSTIVNADMIYFIEDGKVVDYGTHSNLLENCAEYRRLFTTQFSKTEQLTHEINTTYTA